MWGDLSKTPTHWQCLLPSVYYSYYIDEGTGLENNLSKVMQLAGYSTSTTTIIFKDDYQDVNGDYLSFAELNSGDSNSFFVCVVILLKKEHLFLYDH